MSENIPEANKAILHRYALSYLLAGDLESIEALEIISERIRTIDWTDREFLQFTAEMRAGMPQLTEEEEKSFQKPAMAMVHVLLEQLIASRESSMALRKTLIEANRALAFLKGLIAVHQRSIDRLHLLGDDIESHEFPKYPEGSAT